MIICANCNTPNNEGSKFCAQCGSKLEQKRICPECMAELDSGAKFCPQCGCNLSNLSNGISDNVFGGNVDGSFNTTNNFLNTFHNESADVIECEVCGKMLSKGSGEAYKCRRCGKYYCTVHFDTEYNMCSVCAQEPRKTKEKEKAVEKKSREETEAFYSTFISEYNEDSGNYTITGIRDKNIEKAIIPDNVEAIGDRAFKDCKNLLTVEIPDSVKKIGAEAFSGCEKLNDVSLPFGVERVEDGCFEGCRSIDSIVLSDNVSYIGKKAFYKCSKLQFVSLPHGLKTLGERAFGYCQMETIVFPHSLSAIPTGCFECCGSLNEIVFNKGLKSIGLNAFSNCDSLEEAVLPEGLESISSGAFEYCNALSYVYIPASVKYLNAAFIGCDSVSFEVSPENKKYHTKNACLIETDAKRLLCMGVDGSIPDDGSVKIIGDGAFWEFSEISEINIPEGVEVIEDEAFNSCYALEKLYVPSTVKSIGTNAFDNCNEGLVITYGGTRSRWDAMYTEYDDEIEVVCLGKAAVKDVAFGSEVKAKDNGASFTVSSDWFSDDDEEIEEDIDDEEYDINEGGFTDKQIKAMESILGKNSAPKHIIDALAENIDNIRAIDEAYRKVCGNEDVKEEVIIVSKENNVSKPVTPKHALAQAAKPQSVQVKPKEVQTKPKEEVKKESPAPVAKVILKNGQTVSVPVTSCVFNPGYKENKDIVKVILPASVTSIGNEAFQCSSLVEIEAPSVTSIGSRAFYGCVSLKTAKFTKGITRMDFSAFECCYSLEEINLSKGLDSIGNSVFRYCKNLSRINIPESVRGINDSAFAGCESLSEVYLCNNVSYIGKNAFSDCKNLAAVRVADCKNDLLRSGKGLESIFSDAFIRCDNLREINLPQSIRRIDEDAFKGCEKLVIKADPNNFYYDVKGNCLITKDSNTLVFANALSVIPADGSVKALGNRCMVAQKSLKSINIPMGVTTIGTEAFAGCSSLESVRLPSSIKTLGLCMFFGCNNLKEVVFDGTKAEWDAINKGEMGANFTVYVKGLFGAKKAIRIKSGITI